MEMACLQLLVSLTQVLFIPVDGRELKARIGTPITEGEYYDAVEGKVEWFDMDHPEHPFMQVSGVTATEPTDMAKLFAGLTGSTSGTFVNEPNLASKLCPSCTALGLFNQAMNCPSFGGGFKASLRGSAPISTLVLGDNLRHTLWLNILCKPVLADVMPWHESTTNEKPNWVDLVKPKDKIAAHETGLLRGLFWQPAHIELMREEGRGDCDCCGQEEQRYLGFNKEKFVYEFSGVWPHPLCPRIYKLTKGEREEKFSSFTTNAPSWTLLNQFLIQEDLGKEGRIPAPVVSQARSLLLSHGMLHLMVGGYRNNQASILERRHELFSIAKEWENNDALIARIVDTGLAYKTELRKKLYGFFKATGAAIQDQAEHRFYRETEPLVHDMLRNMNFKESKAAFADYHLKLRQTVRAIFGQVTDPYQNEPKMIHALAVARRGLEKSLAELN
jgi:CRISPR system Cascade subunit CasA